MGGLPGSEPGRDGRFLSVPEVAAMLGMRPSWVYKQAETRKIPSHKFGHYRRFDRADIEAYIERQRIETRDG